MGITKKTTPCLNWPNNSLMNAQTVNNPAIGPPIQKSRGADSRAVKIGIEVIDPYPPIQKQSRPN